MSRSGSSGTASPTQSVLARNHPETFLKYPLPGARFNEVTCIRVNVQSNENMKKLITLALGLAMSATAFAGEFADITIADLKKAIADKTVTVIDVNGSKSYQAGHIPTAIDFAKDKATIEKALPTDKAALIVAYCGGPQCNAYQAAAKKAKELGYTNVKHLSVGIAGWKEAGEKTEVATY